MLCNSSLSLIHYYTQVQPIVQHFEEQYAKQFWLISDWAEEGQYVLLTLLNDQPDLLMDIVRLRLTFRVQFIKHLRTIMTYQD